MKARRRPVLDEYVEEGESALLLNDQVVVVSPLGTTLLAAMDEEWVGVPHLSAALLNVYGPPPEGDVESATVDALRALEGQGIVEVAD